jgi:outer membrane protein OmpA-like peptidoglycan-associated protein
MKSKLVLLLLVFGVLFSSNQTLMAQKDKKSKEKSAKDNKKDNKKRKLSFDAKVGDKYFENDEFFMAAQSYQKALQKDGKDFYAAFKMGEAYRAFFDYNKAEAAYARVSDSKEGSKEFPLAVFWHGIMLKTNGKYDKAKDVLQKFIDEFSPQTDEEKVYIESAELELNGAKLALNEMKKPVRDYKFKVLPQPINSQFSDYAPSIFEHDTSIVITSARPGAKGDNKDPRTGEVFSDNFRFYKDPSGRWKKYESQDKFDENINTLLNDGAGVFNRDKTKYYYTNCSQGDYCSIWVAEQKDGKWQKPTKLNKNINPDEFASKQPTLSFTGDTMFFVSDRPGGKGENDIWYSVRQGQGENWGAAINLEAVNTPYIDMSPCYYTLGGERVLFFASNGRESFGGLDIFMAKGENFEFIVNSGLPFNSNRDDFYFVLGDSIGYMTSNREGGSGNDDIYTFSLKSKGALIATIAQDSITGYESISIAGKLLNDDINAPAADVTMALSDDKDMKLKTTTTNKHGEFKFDNLATDKGYKVGVDESGVPITKKSNVRVEDLKVYGSSQKASRTLFENIYFDFDKADLRPEAVKVLDELVKYIKNNPNVQIEINANTDAIGSSEYNKKLSERRGQAAKDYLQKALDPTKIVVNAIGKDNPIATNANEAGRQLNRRVEFYILGGADYQAKAMAYIVPPKTTLTQIAREYGMTVAELKELNNLTDADNIKAFQPIRVRNNGEGVIAPVSMAAVSAGKGGITKVAAVKPLNDGESYYTVAPQNTLFSIAKMHNMTVEELKSLNGLTSDHIKVGQKLKVKKQ